jgi:hypothetical protein
MAYPQARSVVSKAGWIGPTKPYCDGSGPIGIGTKTPICGAGFTAHFFKLMPEAIGWPADAADILGCYDKGEKRLLLSFSYDEDYTDNAQKAIQSLRVNGWRIENGHCKDW